MKKMKHFGFRNRFKHDNTDRTSGPQLEENVLRKVDKSGYWFLFTGLLFISSIILGMAGFYSLPGYTVQDSLYSTFRLFILNFDAPPPPYPLSLEIARWLAMATAFSSIIQAASIVFSRQANMVRLLRYRNHHIICGLNLYTKQLALDLLQQGCKVVVLDKNPHNIYAEIIRQFKGIVLPGNPLDTYILHQARVHRAACVIIFTVQDQVNMEIYLQIKSLIEEPQVGSFRHNITELPLCIKEREPAPGLAVKIHLFEKRLSEMVEYHEGRQKSKLLDIRLFNIYDNAAKTMFQNQPLYANAKDCLDQIHLVIIGFNQLAEQIVLQAAHIAHYGLGKRPRITVFGESARDMDWFLLKHEGIDRACELEFKEDVIKCKEIYKKIETLAPPATYIVLCIENDEEAVLQALIASEQIRDLPIMVNVSDNYYLSSMLENDQLKFFNVHVFNQPEKVAGCEAVLNEELDRLAVDIHDYYLRGKESRGPDYPRSDELVKLKEWQRLSVFKKEDNRAQADHIDTKLFMIGLIRIKKDDFTDVLKDRVVSKEEFDNMLTPDLIEKVAKSEHERWNAIHFMNGWQKSPPDEIKDEHRKRHPCLVEWDEFEEVSIAQSKIRKQEVNYHMLDRQVVRDLYDLLTRHGYLLLKAT